MIKELMEEGLLLTFDRSRNRYQIVPLFARYISWKNERLPEEIRNRYLNRLAEWYLKKDENERARRLYYRIKNFDALMDAAIADGDHWMNVTIGLDKVLAQREALS